MMEIRACIFDMDDLLVRSGPLWRAAEVHLLNHLGAQLSESLALKYKGMNALDVARVIHAELAPKLPISECQQILRQRLIEEFAGNIEPMPGASQLVNHLCGRYPLAVASGSPLQAIQAALSKIGIVQCFDRIISSEAVPRGKPHPDVFLEAAAQLGHRPEHCVVFEDSLVGVQAAHAAGMYCYAIPSCHPKEIAALATSVFDDLGQITAVL
jgi:HAD superfamily hydrolase (TIGR01509 family)